MSMSEATAFIPPSVFSLPPVQSNPVVDHELSTKSKKATERISENMHIVANEPSLAFYRVQEHVRKALPPMVSKRVEVKKLNLELQGRCYDLEYALGAVKAMSNAGSTFKNLQDLTKNAIYFKQQLKYEETRRSKKEPSVYKRLSAHISQEIPDLAEISDALRETASRVESMMTHARGSSGSAPVATEASEAIGSSSQQQQQKD
ncbi:BLOC-1-related complex subunit 8 homolog [Neocloeon triangulifer]|uniref:BLOC-1-related complex subunit 8 homolog n=1 Tax=Neocloeon triangulifer TaxID=2078957 RepID=UPI00286ECE11|nr:BLOC-1-related complex subunit 8 homolog [Neocloeon triangulifer]XP_059474339.1 BLOC-1-related complex subunit 8 homolog [Neocloeon triangulifer]